MHQKDKELKINKILLTITFLLTFGCNTGPDIDTLLTGNLAGGHVITYKDLEPTSQRFAKSLLTTWIMPWTASLFVPVNVTPGNFPSQWGPLSNL